ncbi:SUKH-4 family immunity protein [Streptomyces sp. AC512_CC834]|uniref:SUKH-4 family immunity protein n=1 Tax=Streptomyces sp. AC512_CC834 TaxID=2823691 RepID=UPI0020B7D773|nr:SUKH-4 family immunity protein [Streptomyces sp. AC512_CC834]
MGEKTTARSVPSLLTLVRLVTSVDDPSWTRGILRPAPAGCETPPPLWLWKTYVLVGCLFLTAGRRAPAEAAPGLPARFLDREFGRSRVTRFEEADFPGTLTHEPTRRFLCETGLPDHGPFLGRTDEGLPVLPTLAEYASERADAPPLPDHADHLLHLGGTADGIHLLVHGTTGEVLTWCPPEGAPLPLAPDLSVLAFGLWLRHRASRGAARDAALT